MDHLRPSQSEQPTFPNPVRIHGIAECVLGLMLLALGGHGWQVARRTLRDQFPDLSIFEFTEILARIGGDVSKSVQIGGPALAGLMGVVAGLAYLLASISKICMAKAPSQAPGDWKKLESLLWGLRHSMVPPTHQKRGGLIGVFRSYVSDAIDHVPRSYQPVVLGHIASVPYIFGAMVLLSLLSLVPVPLGDFGAFGPAYFHAPFPTLGLAILGSVIIFQLVVAKLLLPTVPEAEVSAFRHQVKSSGHPRTVFEELRSVLAAQAGGQTSRSLVENELRIESDSVSDVGKAVGALAYESQPRPIREESGFPRVIAHAHSILGGLLVLSSVGFLIALRSSWLPSHPQLGTNLAQPIVTGVTGVLVFWLGARLFSQAILLLRRDLFRSSVCAVDLTGTFFRSEIAVGMGSGDSIRSSSAAVRGELFLDYMIATCVSEADHKGKRHLVELRVDNDAKRHLEALRRTVTWNEERGASLLGVELLTSHQAREIAQANTAVVAARQQKILLQQEAPVHPMPDAPTPPPPRWAAHAAAHAQPNGNGHVPIQPDQAPRHYSPNPYVGSHPIIDVPALPEPAQVPPRVVSPDQPSPFTTAAVAHTASVPASPYAGAPSPPTLDSANPFTTTAVARTAAIPASPYTLAQPGTPFTTAASARTAMIPPSPFAAAPRSADASANPFATPAVPYTASVPPSPFTQAAPISGLPAPRSADVSANPFATPAVPYTASVPPSPFVAAHETNNLLPHQRHALPAQPQATTLETEGKSPVLSVNGQPTPFASSSPVPPAAIPPISGPEPFPTEVLQVLPGKNVPLTPEQLMWMRQHGLPQVPTASVAPMPDWMAGQAAGTAELVPLSDTALPVPVRAATPEPASIRPAPAELPPPAGVVLSPQETPVTFVGSMKCCPGCAEPLAATIRMCPYCGHRLA